MSKHHTVTLFTAFRYPNYRNLCIANFLANIGLWIQIFSTGWIIASQTRDPSISVISQTMSQIPVFLFSIPGGLLSDRMNHFKYLFSINFYIVGMLSLLGLITLSGQQVNVMLFFTFLIFSGNALKSSTWQATMSNLVTHEEIESSATLNGLSYNLASIIGPIIGSLMFLFLEPGFLYITSAFSLLPLLYLYYKLQKSSAVVIKENKIPLSELFMQGVRICYSNSSFRYLISIVIFLFFSISSFQSLLPIYVTNVLYKGSNFLSYLMCAFGFGAITSAFFMPAIRARILRHKIISIFPFFFGVCLMIIACKPTAKPLMLTAFFSGFFWAGIVSTVNSIAQSIFQREIRSRCLSIYSMFFYGSLAVGSFTWGKVSKSLSIESSFFCTGTLIILTSIFIFLSNCKVVKI